MSQEIQRLRSQSAALEQLLNVYEQTVLEKSGELEAALAELARINEALLKEVADRQRAEAALRRAQRDLEKRVEERTADLIRANQELDAFANVASHDLQEPLRKIQAFGRQLAERCGGSFDADGRQWLERMMTAAERMRRLINDLLTLSRIATSTATFVPVQLSRITRDVLADLEVRVQESGAHVEVEDLPVIEADPTQMRQLLQNLIGNALKFRNKTEQPRVRISARVGQRGANPAGVEGLDGSCQLTVEDNGIGFDERCLDRMFEVFQRLHGRSEYEGSGIGLAVCRKIVERHGGRLTARSVVGQGSTFRVTLPLIQHGGQTNEQL